MTHSTFTSFGVPKSKLLIMQNCSGQNDFHYLWSSDVNCQQWKTQTVLSSEEGKTLTPNPIFRSFVTVRLESRMRRCRFFATECSLPASLYRKNGSTVIYQTRKSCLVLACSCSFARVMLQWL